MGERKGGNVMNDLFAHHFLCETDLDQPTETRKMHDTLNFGQWCSDARSKSTPLERARYPPPCAFDTGSGIRARAHVRAWGEIGIAPALTKFCTEGAFLAFPIFFRIWPVLLGGPHNLFRRFWDNFGHFDHFWAILDHFWVGKI